MEELKKTFVAQKRFAVAGSFKDQTKYAYRIFRKLIAKGCIVYPVTPAIREIEGIPCYKSILDIPLMVDAVSLVTPPAVTEKVVEQCLDKGVKIVWMQPGAESSSAIDFCKKHNIKTIYNTCILTHE